MQKLKDSFLKIKLSAADCLFVNQNRFLVEFDSTTHKPEAVLEISIDEKKSVKLHKVRTSPRPKNFNSAAIYSLSQEDRELFFSNEIAEKKISEHGNLLHKLNDQSRKPKHIKKIYLEAVGKQHAKTINETSQMVENSELWKQWYLHKSGMSSVVKGMRLNSNQNYPKIAIFDSGIEVDSEGKIVHPNLVRRGNVFLKSMAETGKSRVAKREEIVDLNGHGTHVCGLIGASSQNGEDFVGINPHSEIHIYKCSQGSSEFCYPFDLVDSIFSFASELKSTERAVLNISIGFNFNDTNIDNKQKQNHILASYSDTHQYLKSLFSHLESCDNILLVVSSGNEFKEQLDFPANLSKNYPTLKGDNNNILAVGAIDIDNNVVPFSNYGEQLSLVAPGKGVYSIYPSLYNVRNGYPLGSSGGYAYLEGTSMSAAVVTGVASLYWSTLGNDKKHTAAFVAKTICEASASGNKVTDPKKNYYGFGALQSEKLFNSSNSMVKTQRREILNFSDENTQVELRKVFLKLFDTTSPKFFNEVSQIVRQNKTSNLTSIKKPLQALFKKNGCFTKTEMFSDAIVWGFSILFDEKYNSIWQIKSILKCFVEDIDLKIREGQDSDLFDLSQFQTFLHQCWSSDPSILKEFLLLYYPDEVELFEANITADMLIAFVRLSSDDNLVPITPYTPNFDGKNLKTW